MSRKIFLERPSILLVILVVMSFLVLAIGSGSTLALEFDGEGNVLDGTPASVPVVFGTVGEPKAATVAVGLDKNGNVRVPARVPVVFSSAVLPLAATIGLDARNGFRSDGSFGAGSGFDTFRATIVSAGHQIVLLTSFLADDLAGLDAIFLNQTYGTPYSSAEISAIQDFVSGGGGGVFAADGGSGANYGNTNALVEAFGVTYSSSPTDGSGHTITGFVSHPVTTGLSSIGVDYQVPMTSITSPAVDLTTNGGSDNALAAITGTGGSGNAVFLSDASLWWDSNEGSDTPITFGDNALLLSNVLDWVVGPTSVVPPGVATIGLDARSSLGFGNDDILATGSDFDTFRATIISAGHQIVPLTSFLADNLAGLDAIFLNQPFGTPYSSAEISAIQDFVSGGGGGVFIADGGSDADYGNMNALVAAFGVTYSSSPTDGSGHTITGFVSHPVTTGLSSIGVDYQVPMTSITSPAVDLTTSGGSDNALAAATGTGGSGNAVFLSDGSLWIDHDEGPDTPITFGDNALLLSNVIDWVVGPPVGVRTLSIGSVDVAPGDTAVVQISIDDASHLASGDMVIEYDASIITINDVTATSLISGMLLIVNNDTPGEIRIAMAGTTGITSGSGALLDISLTVSSSAAIGTETILSFDSAGLYAEEGETIPVALRSGTVTIVQPCVKGDVNNDGGVHSNDATLVLRYIVGLLTFNDYQMCAADVNDDGQINTVDATLILRQAAGLAPPSKDVIAGADGRITVTLSEAHGVAGESVTVPVRVNSVDMLSSGDICIAYNPAVLRATGVSSDPGLLLVSNITEPGIVRMAFAGASGLDNATIAEIQFNVLTDNLSLIEFRDVDLYGTDTLPLTPTFIDGRFMSLVMSPPQNDLLQNYPNPFNPETWIPYHLMENSDVTIRIYDIRGQLIRVLDLDRQNPGLYTTASRAAHWDGKNEAGEEIASGTYFYNITAGDFSATRKMVVRR